MQVSANAAITPTPAATAQILIRANDNPFGTFMFSLIDVTVLEPVELFGEANGGVNGGSEPQPFTGKIVVEQVGYNLN